MTKNIDSFGRILDHSAKRRFGLIIGGNMGNGERGRAKSFHELQVYDISFRSAMEIFEFTKAFPKEERYSLTDQIRRSSRSVCANIAEAWEKRHYPMAFASKLTDSLAEAAETRTWIDFAIACNYVESERVAMLQDQYRNITAKLIIMIHSPEKWKV